MTLDSAPAISQLACFGRACRGEHYSGDVAFIHEDGSRIFVAIVDAAGHGRSAYQVASQVETILRAENSSELTALIQSLHRQLTGGLGGVIIAGTLDSESLEFNYVQVGDSHGKIFGPRRRSLVGQAGMLGHAIRTPIVRNEKLASGDTLVLCTDGISERYDLSEIQGHRTMPAEALARLIVKQFGKDHDDATCLVVQCG